jgi:hypothetical protein
VGEGHQIHIGPVKNQFHAHQNTNGVPFGGHANDTTNKQNGTNHQILAESGLHEFNNRFFEQDIFRGR